MREQATRPQKASLSSFSCASSSPSPSSYCLLHMLSPPTPFPPFPPPATSGRLLPPAPPPLPLPPPSSCPLLLSRLHPVVPSLPFPSFPILSPLVLPVGTCPIPPFLISSPLWRPSRRQGLCSIWISSLLWGPTRTASGIFPSKLHLPRVFCHPSPDVPLLPSQWKVRPRQHQFHLSSTASVHSPSQSLRSHHFTGVCDRHKSNMMLGEDGTFFHIDFSHILGDHVTIDADVLAIPTEFQTAFGPRVYKDFEILCTTAYEVSITSAATGQGHGMEGKRGYRGGRRWLQSGARAQMGGNEGNGGAGK